MEITNDKMDRIDEILFSMIRDALIKASVPITLMVLFLIIGIAPLYVMYGIIDRNIPIKTK